MKNIKLFDKQYTTFAWGALFLLLGILMAIPGDQNVLFVLGAGSILLGLNLARALSKMPVSAFSITLGVLAVGVGAYALLRPLLHSPHFEVGLIPLGLIVIGLYVLIPGSNKTQSKV